MGALALVVVHVFDIPIKFNAIRVVSLFLLAGGLLSIIDTWRTWFFRLAGKTRFSPPVLYGYPGWRAVIQSQFVSGCFLIGFGLLLFFAS